MVSKIAEIAPVGAVNVFQGNDRTYGDLLKKRKEYGFQKVLRSAMQKETQRGDAYRVNLLHSLR